MEAAIGQIILCAFTFQQETTLLCDGSVHPTWISYELFSLLGKEYGGDGQQTFGVPNLPVPAPLTAANATWQITIDGPFLPYGLGNDQFIGQLDLFADGPNPSDSGQSAYVAPSGQFLAIPPYEALYSLIVNTYGGNGTTDFALPTLGPPSGPNTAGTTLGYGICFQGGLYPSRTQGATPDSTIGTLELFAFPWVPFNFLPCNGQSVLVTAYPALHSVIGNAFGGGGPSFNVPNMTAPAGMAWGIVANGVMPSNVNET